MSDLQVVQVVNCVQPNGKKMGSQLFKFFDVPLPPGPRAKYLVKSCGDFLCAYLTKWTDLTKNDSKKSVATLGNF